MPIYSFISLFIYSKLFSNLNYTPNSVLDSHFLIKEKEKVQRFLPSYVQQYIE